MSRHYLRSGRLRVQTHPLRKVMNVNSVQSLPSPKQIAFAFGRQDAQDGEICVPEQFYTRKALQIAYALGFASHAGMTDTVKQIVGVK
jgi:hypothetical protein